MGRGRGKGKKLTVTNHEEPGSGDEEKIPAQKRRGRPQKPLKDEIDEEEVPKIEDDDSNKDSSMTAGIENGKRRKRNSTAKEKPSGVKDEDVVNGSLVGDVSSNTNGFRHVGSRRKNKPRRAAEVGVEC